MDINRKVGAEDYIDKLMVEKYEKETLVIKNNYNNAKMKENNYLPRDVDSIKEFYHPCMVNYDDIKSRMLKIHKENATLKKHQVFNKKKIEKLKKNMQDLTNPNKMYERLGIDIIQIVTGNGLTNIVNPDNEDNLLVDIAILRTKMVDTLGYIIPNIRIMDSSNIEPLEYNIFIRDKLVHKSILDKTISDNDKKTEIITNLQKIFIKYASQIISKADVIKYIELVLSQDPTLVNDLVPILLSPIDLKHILVKLIQEQISIKDIIYVFELLNDYARYTNDVDILAEQLKRDLQF